MHQWERMCYHIPMSYQVKELILLGGGSKKRQQKDIDEAVALWED